MTDEWLIAVDPGLRCLGVAVFFNGWLNSTYLIKNPEAGRGAKAWHGYTKTKMTGTADLLKDVIAGADVLVVEMQSIYRRGPGDPDDMLQVAGVAGVIAGMANLDARIVAYKPREWKGTAPKDIFAKRILACLSSRETFAISTELPKSLVHNIYDAIGLGLKALGRLDGHVFVDTKGKVGPL